MRFLSASLDALLVELDDLPTTLALFDALQAEPLAGVEDIVPAARTLLIRHRPHTVSREQLIAHIAARKLGTRADRSPTLIEIPVDYQGEDLDEVAERLGLSRDELIRRHTACEYTVAFTGFAPGFAYLSGGDPGLNVPRRPTPRTRIPAGAVGLAGPFSGIYPQASPGGWQIIGITSTRMWDLSRPVPALLQPGFRVHFVDTGNWRGMSVNRGVGQPLMDDASMDPQVSTQATQASTTEPAAAPVSEQAASSARPAMSDQVTPAATTPALLVHHTGPQALFQDLGRHGHASQGVSASGAMDKGALRSANRLVGNAPDTACIEIAGGGFEIEAGGDSVVVVTGADATIQLTTTHGSRRSLPSHQAFALCHGDRLSLAEPRAGLRSYLAVRGGFEVAPVLGSCSSDTLAQIGPPAITAGDRLPIRPVTHGAVVGEPEAPSPALPSAHETVTLDVVMGPRTDWFTAEAVARLSSQSWTVTPQSNRIGLRLHGEQALARINTAELPSEGTVIGAIQVPPNGQPVLFLADHPLTGGYPVIGSVAPHHLALAGQLPVGACVRFRAIQPFFAHST